MEWKYLGIDEDPPRGPLLIWTSQGEVLVSHKDHPTAVAWAERPTRNPFKEECVRILHGLPELHMIGCILKNEELFMELAIGVHSYQEGQLAEFTELVRTLDNKAHHGRSCSPNFHKHHG